MWSRFKSGLRTLWAALLSCAWMVPLAMAGDRMLAYLNDDLARLHLRSAVVPGGAPSLLDINESPNITAARVLLLVSVLLLAAAVVFWSLRAHRSLVAQGQQGEGLRLKLRERERALDQQFQHLEAEVHRGREALLGEYARMAEATSSGSVASVFDGRFERLEILLSRHLDEMDRRIGAVEGALRTSGEQLAHQFVDLRDRVVQVQSVNNSSFGDLASAPMPLGAVIGDNARLHDIVLNLTHLQEDLRLERRQLRKRLQNLPDAAPRQAPG